MIKTYTFNDKESLKELIEKDKKFKLVLPHFQRRFVWDVKDQKSLLQSMLSGVPVGGVLLLDGKKDDYVSRPLCFNKLDPEISDDKCIFLLDGQQRMSTMKSMFCDLLSPQEIKRFKGVNNWKELLDKVPSKLHYRWFISIEENNKDIFGLKGLRFNDDEPLVPSDFDECINFYKIFKSKEKEYNPDKTNKKLVNWSVKHNYLPLCLLSDDRFSFKEVLTRIARDKHTDSKETREIDEWVESVTVFLEARTLNTVIHQILLGESGMQIGISIFEQVNRGGVKLDIYDLVVARMAFHKENLTDKIREICKNKQTIIPEIDNDARDGFNVQNLGAWDDKDDIPSKPLKKAFKNCLAICELKNNQGLDKLTDKYIKERNLLSLDKNQIFENWEETVLILFSVFQFLHFRCGVAKLKDIPYELLIVPLFVFFAKHDNKPSKGDINGMEFWYWSSIFSGHYREKQSTRVIEDSKTIIKDGKFKDRSDKIFKEKGYSDKSSLIRERENSRQPQVDRALIQYVVSKEPYDLQGTKKKKRTIISAYKQAKNVDDEGINTQEHHIIPINEIKESYDGDGDKLRKDKEHYVNSALNKVVISDEANWKIQRITDYKDNSNHLNCKSNFIPTPTEKKYTKDTYDLKSFLSDRFDLLETDIKCHLEKLITD